MEQAPEILDIVFSMAIELVDLEGCLVANADPLNFLDSQTLQYSDIEYVV